MPQKGLTSVYYCYVHLSHKIMFDHLFKICLSVILVTSLMVPVKWCCADKDQEEPGAIAAIKTCCGVQTEQSSIPADQTHDCACCDANVFATTANVKIAPQTTLFSNYTQPKTVQPEIGQTVDNLSPSDQSRPLHLMHCVWIC